MVAMAVLSLIEPSLLPVSGAIVVAVAAVPVCPVTSLWQVVVVIAAVIRRVRADGHGAGLLDGESDIAVCERTGDSHRGKKSQRSAHDA
jgi:hypothetical protein